MFYYDNAIYLYRQIKNIHFTFELDIFFYSKYSKMKTTKIIFFATTAILLSFLTTSCIPTTPVGGNPTLSNQFDINISDLGLAYDEMYNHPANVSVKKYIAVDGDSIKFKIIRSIYMLPRQDFFITFKNPNAGFQFLTEIDSSNPTNTYKELRPIAAGINIPSQISSDTTLVWTNQYATQTIPYNNTSYYDADGFYFGHEDSDINNRGHHSINVGDIKYIVFRKPVGNNYQYYWVKLQYNLTDFSVLNGRYQMNSITTGQ